MMCKFVSKRDVGVFLLFVVSNVCSKLCTVPCTCVNQINDQPQEDQINDQNDQPRENGHKKYDGECLNRKEFKTNGGVDRVISGNGDGNDYMLNERDDENELNEYYDNFYGNVVETGNGGKTKDGGKAKDEYERRITECRERIKSATEEYYSNVNGPCFEHLTKGNCNKFSTVIDVNLFKNHTLLEIRERPRYDSFYILKLGKTLLDDTLKIIKNGKIFYDSQKMESLIGKHIGQYDLYLLVNNYFILVKNYENEYYVISAPMIGLGSDYQFMPKKGKEYNGNVLNSSIKEFYVLRNGIEKCASLSNFFIGFSELSIVNVHYLDTCNVTNMSHMFNGCSSLIELPDISEWNTKSVTNMEGMFCSCYSLKTLPDISKWNTENVMDMGGIFCECNLLTALPDISKWNTSNVTNMRSMFYSCSLLTALPDISEWNTNKVTNMSYMFSGCKKLTALPDISKWNTENVTNISSIFRDCQKLVTLPDISKWNISNAIDISYMFYGCSSLQVLPDIVGRWSASNIRNAKSIIAGCKSLVLVPDFSKLGFCNVVNLEQDETDSESEKSLSDYINDRSSCGDGFKSDDFKSDSFSL